MEGVLTYMVVALLLCTPAVRAGSPAFDPKLILEIAKQFDPNMLTPSCRKVFHKCKTQFVPLLMQLESLLKKVDAILEVECITKELAKGFPRFDLECVMTEDYQEGIRCLEDRTLLDALGSKAAKTVQQITECIKDVPPPA
ncbi:uncharacterized protein LOC144163980 [Haemaphysalis longicornis]